MKTALFIITAIWIIIISVAVPAYAAPACGDRQAMVYELREKFAETPSAMGLEDRGSMVELFASDAGTWTLLVSGDDGNACIVATGVNFKIEKPGVKG